MASLEAAGNIQELFQQMDEMRTGRCLKQPAAAIWPLVCQDAWPHAQHFLLQQTHENSWQEQVGQHDAQIDTT